MILESNRMVSDWFAGTTYGFNALLASTPLDSGDSRPASLATITNETEDGNTARGELPALKPALTVAVDQITDLDGQVMTVTRDGRLKLRIRIGVDNADSAAAMRDLSYYLRTALRSWKVFTSDAHNADRTRNNIYLETCHEITTAIAWTPDKAGNSTLSGYLFPIVQLRDLAP